MLQIIIEKSFKKDINRDKKSGKYSTKDFELLKSILVTLQNQQQIKPRHKRHPLKGKLKGFESIHIKSDWLLIFKVDSRYIYPAMLGKHSHVYKKFK